MPFFPSPVKGDPVQFHAARERALNDMLAEFGVASVSPMHGGRPQYFSVSGTPERELTAFCAVKIRRDAGQSDSLSHGVFPIKVAEPGDTDFAISPYPLMVGQVGKVIMAGLVASPVIITDAVHDYVVAGANGTLVSAAAGSCRILWQESATGEYVWCLLLLAGSGAGTSGDYDGAFAAFFDPDGTIGVNGGFANLNGEMTVPVSEKPGIQPQTGYICVCAAPDATGTWSPVEVRFAAPAPWAYPIAEVTQDEDGIFYIEQYRIGMAIIMISTVCPMAQFAQAGS